MGYHQSLQLQSFPSFRSPLLHRSGMLDSIEDAAALHLGLPAAAERQGHLGPGAHCLRCPPTIHTGYSEGAPVAAFPAALPRSQGVRWRHTLPQPRPGKTASRQVQRMTCEAKKLGPTRCLCLWGWRVLAVGCPRLLPTVARAGADLHTG
jgi:hypothetical protein